MHLHGCAVSPETVAARQAMDAEIDTILNSPPDGAELGASRRCLADSDYRSFRALDDRHIVFEGRRDRLWVNTLRSRCPDLRHGRTLIVRHGSLGSRLCDADTFGVDDWFHWPWYRRMPWRWNAQWSTGMTCTLGEFLPVTEGQVEAIERLLDEN